MGSTSFLKQCIAEVLLEPVFAAKSHEKVGVHFNSTKKIRVNKVNDLIKECISEIIIEPYRKMKVYGNPQRLQSVHLIKECVMEVLKENLTEGFDPLSDAGPNPTQENPYPEWNNKMRNLEETEKQSGAIYKAFQDGRWTYWMNNFDGAGKIPIRPENVKKYLDQGYRLINLEPLTPVAEEHPHGRYAQEAGATPYMASLNEQYPLQSTSIKWKCPHCSGVTKILIEIESPSDYISCSDCDHCKREINDPYLDTRIYEKVISHFAGRKLLK